MAHIPVGPGSFCTDSRARWELNIGRDQIGFTLGRRAAVFHKYQRYDDTLVAVVCGKLHGGEA